jgi:ABC-type bacteriocin/lantibiotic exporter with double-glycine peptidase domain
VRATSPRPIDGPRYFGGSLVVVPLVQGGTLATSIVFLLIQNAALALAALMMLPVQLTLLPPLQRRLNAKVRERVHATRALGGLLTAAPAGREATPPRDRPARTPARSRQMRLAEYLERVRVEINDLKGRLKVVQERLSLGALVAALAAYREIAPAMREVFDFVQSWSDANARFEEVTTALRPAPPDPAPR